jgi:divalent metal cation (Fe/Co/Zn/Cd) transporter
MEASGTHLLGDTWSTLAMLLGLAMIRFTGLQWFDSLFALGFGVFILV